MSFSDKIKVVRKKTFLSQTAFAKELNVSFSTVSRWENGKSMPNLSAMKAIKDFCESHNISYQEIEEAWIKSPSK